MLVALAPHLAQAEQNQVLREALEAARAIRDEDSRFKALVALAPHLSEPLLHEALEAARAIENEGSRSEALVALAPHLSEPLLHEALEAARAIRDEEHRSEALAALASRLAELPPTALYSIWSETILFLATRTRRGLLADLGSLVPVLAALGGTEAMAETFRAIQDVGRWWP